MRFLTLTPLIALVGCTALPRLCLDSEETAAYAPLTPPRAIRILTINVWSGLTYSGTCSIRRHPEADLWIAGWLYPHRNFRL